MDFFNSAARGKALYSSALTWFLSSDIRPSCGIVSSRRLLLYGLYHSALNRGRIRFMVTTEAEALEALLRTQPGVLIVTPGLEQGDGFSLLRQASSLIQDLRIILLCDSDHDDLVVAAQSAADGVLCEQDLLTPEQPLRTMVIELSLGRRYRSPRVQAALAEAESEAAKAQSWRQLPPPLTPREQDLIDLWVQGVGDREAADQLGLSYETVRSYGRTLRRKLGVNSRAQVLLKVLAMGVSKVAGRSI